MRIYRRREFLALPEGTIYAKGKPWYFKNLNIKADTTASGIDWWSLDPCWVDSVRGDDAFDRLDEMLEKGVSYPMMDAYSRDGLGEDDALFLVFEVPDLLRLRGMIDKAIEVAR